MSNNNFLGRHEGRTLTDPNTGYPIDVIVDGDGNRRLAVDAALSVESATINIRDLDATIDSIRVQDPDTGAHVKVNLDGSTDVNTIIDAASDNIAIRDELSGNKLIIYPDGSLNATVNNVATETTLSSIDSKVPANLTVSATRLLVDSSGVTQPISAVSLPLPTGAATSALQTSGNSSLSSIDSKIPAGLSVSVGKLLVDGSGVIQPVSGSVAISNFPATQPVSGTVTVEQPIGTSLHTVIDSGTISLPSGASTSALQLSGNASLASIDTKLTNPLPVSQSGTWTVQPGNTANTTPWLTTINQGGNSALVSASNALKVDGSAVTQPISGTVTANAGTNLNTSALALDVTLTNRTQKTQITDGTRDGTIKAASTASVAADTSLVVALSPNSPLPAGTSIIGALSANQSVNVSQFGGSSIVTGTGTSGSGIPRVTVSNDSNILATQSGTWTVQQGAPPWSVAGNVASAATDSGNPVKIGSKFNSALPTVTDGQRVDSQADANGRLLTGSVNLDPYKATYSAATISVALAASTTDFFTITGSSTKTIRIQTIGASFTGGGLVALVQAVKRSTANTGGTSANIVEVPHDSTSAAATATVLSYTANPTLGTLVGPVRSTKAVSSLTSSTTAPTLVIYEFGNSTGSSLILRGTSEVLALNLNATTSATNASAWVTWTEE